MSTGSGTAEHPSYFAELAGVTRRAATQLVRPPSHFRRVEAAQRLVRQLLVLGGIGLLGIVALMLIADAAEIAIMPPRGSASLWVLRILTDFGKDAYVLGSLAAALVGVGVSSANLKGAARARLLGLGTRLQYLFFAVLLPVLAGQCIKWAVGRGRPFVGGKDNPFNFAPFNGTEAYFSFPSSHAVTSAALAFAVSAIWPRAQPFMIIYALLIAMTRLVLVAHHPSDVLAGMAIGVMGAMIVRYWFAVRRLGFAIKSEGEIVPLPPIVFSRSKRVARSTAAP
jgi:membrane-associated phospholipid phosphatase